MKLQTRTKNAILSMLMLFFATPILANPINDFYKAHKNDKDMEAKVIPPKAASLLIDDEYEDAIDILQSMYSLKYLNYYGEKTKISDYSKNAIKSKGTYEEIFSDSDYYRTIHVFGIRKNGKVKKLMAVVESQNQFLLVIGKGSLSQNQIEKFPALSKEIQ